MKKSILAIILAISTMFANAQFKKAELQATGLTCAMCSNAINKALLALPYINTVKSDIRNSSFLITFKENAEVDIDGIKEAVEDAGFAVGKLKMTGNFSGVNVGNDKHVKIGDRVFHFINVDDKVLDGEQTITILDKGFLTAKQFKKIGSSTKMSCLQSGKAESCCTSAGFAAGTRIYHVTI